jgi:hypothetical protein
MHAPDDRSTFSHSVMGRLIPLARRLIPPWEYRHLDAVAGVRLAAGGFHLGIGVVLLSFGHRAETDRERRKCYRWGTWFLVFAAMNFSAGYLDMAVARSTRNGTPRAVRQKSL